MFAGEAIVDVAMRVPAFPVPGGDVLAAASRTCVGGGFNVMAAAARQGMPVLYAGGHGTGPWGDLVRKTLADEGIDILRAPDPAQDTGFAIGFTDPHGERAYATQLGAESAHDPATWIVRPDDAVYLSGYGLLSPAGDLVAAWAANLPAGPLLFLDPGPLVSSIPAARLTQVLTRCTWLSLNTTEATRLAGTEDPRAAARTLLGRVPHGSVVVRAGARGCYLATNPPEDVTRFPAPAVDAVDTTGAGDTHCGVFLAALSAGLPARDAAHRATVAAALSVTRVGPATAPTHAELDRADGMTLTCRRDE